MPMKQQKLWWRPTRMLKLKLSLRRKLARMRSNNGTHCNRNWRYVKISWLQWTKRLPLSLRQLNWGGLVLVESWKRAYQRRFTGIKRQRSCWGRRFWWRCCRRKEERAISLFRSIGVFAQVHLYLALLHFCLVDMVSNFLFADLRAIIIDIYIYVRSLCGKNLVQRAHNWVARKIYAN